MAGFLYVPRQMPRPSQLAAVAPVLLGCAVWVTSTAGCSSEDAPARGGPDGAGADARADADGGVLDAGEGGVCTACGACEQALPVLGQSHVDGPIAYPDPPPVGGDHNQCWYRWGRFEQPVPDERWVHNLEHGGVVFLYDCADGCGEQLAELAALAARNPRTVLTPYAELPTRFGVVAWGWRLLSDCLDGAAFQAFYDAHFDHAPESIDAPPPAGCD